MTEFFFKDSEFDFEDSKVILSPAENLAAGVVDVLADVDEIEIQAGSYNLFTKYLAKTAVLDGVPGVVELRTERFGTVTTFSASFELNDQPRIPGEKKTYQWDLNKSLVIRTTRPFTKDANGQKHYGLAEARQVTLNPVVESNVQKIIDAVANSAADEKALEQTTMEFKEFLSGARRTEGSLEAKFVELYSRLMEACGGDEQRAEEIINEILSS